MSLTEIIRDLTRCAKQNEHDANPYLWYDGSDNTRQSELIAVALEQRRMLKILRALKKELNRPDSIRKGS